MRIFAPKRYLAEIVFFTEAGSASFFVLDVNATSLRKCKSFSRFIEYSIFCSPLFLSVHIYYTGALFHTPDASFCS